MANILYRVSQTSTLPASTSVKNLPLTNLELDANFRSIAIDLDDKAKKGANSDITSLGGLTTALSVAQGGTGTKNISGLVKGNGITPFTSADVGLDYGGPTAALSTGIIKSTNGTGAHTIATPSDFPTLNQNTTGTAATATNMPYSGLTGTVPTWNQDTTGTAGNALKLGGKLASELQSTLGFTPVQQGGGTGQGTNKLYIGWPTPTYYTDENGVSQQHKRFLGLQIDTTNYADLWPINIDGNAKSANSAYSSTITSQRSFEELTIAAATSGALSTDSGSSGSYLNMSDSIFRTARKLVGKNGDMGFLKRDGGWGLKNTNDGTIYSPGNIVAYWSDSRLKKNIISKKSVGEIIDAFRVVEYDWDKDALDHYGVTIEAKKNQTGLIAQEAQAVFPNSVVVNRSAELTEIQIQNGAVATIPKDEPLLTIDWDVITPLILKETQDLRSRVRDLEVYTNNLEGIMTSMLGAISKLSDEIISLKAVQ